MTMRCVDVIQEIAAPSSPDPAALAEHLAGCPRCAAWARQSARLDRLWEATRPEEPPPAAWATVWTQVTRSLDAAAPMAPTPRIRPWRRRAVASFAIAQAAVLLVAAWLVSRPDPDRPMQRPGALARNGPALVPVPSIEIDYGATVLIQSRPTGVTVVSQGTGEASNAIDGNLLDGGSDFVMLNALEAMAE
jgi:predicted anti-sigma-YlaC factor YlaD